MLNILDISYIAILILISAGLVLIEAVKRLERGATSPQRTDDRKRVLVIVPCRGPDISLEENLLSLRSQDFGEYSVVAVVDSEGDEAVGPIKRAGVDFIVSDFPCSRCSGKTRAIATAISRFPENDVYVTADSDGTFSSGWLRALVSQLDDPSVGLGTTFPVFVPEGGFWSKVKMVWGFVGTGMMESSLTRFGWGGSLAFRRSMLDERSFGLFSESVSDDGALTHIASKAGLKIGYSDGNLVTVKSRETRRSLVEWSDRQTALAILGNRKLYGMGIVYYGTRLFLLLSSILLSVFLSPFALLLLAPYALNIAKIYRRSGSRDPVVVPIILALDFMYLANLLKAKRMSTITWRGREYELAPGGESL